MSTPPAEPAARPTGRPPLRGVTRGLVWASLGGWIGTWLLFGLVVAPTAFAVLPSTELAGALVGPVLESLQWFGVAAGALLSLLAWRLGRGPVLRALPLAMALACLGSQLGLSPELAALREGAFGPHGNEAVAARFNQLHRLSAGLFLGVGVAALLLVALHARADASEDR